MLLQTPMQSTVAFAPNFAAAPKRLSPLAAAAAATLSIPAAPGQFRLCFSVEFSWVGERWTSRTGSGEIAGIDGSRQAEIQGAQDGRCGEEGGWCCPRTSQRRSCNCAEENSCDPAAESEKESGGYHP